MSEPAKAKSQSCFAQVPGEVNPGLVPQPVRYSTQLGPPSAVAVLSVIYTSQLQIESGGLSAKRWDTTAYLILHNLVRKQCLLVKCQIKSIPNEAKILVSVGPLDVGV